jgi:phospholipase A1/A2
MKRFRSLALAPLLVGAAHAQFVPPCASIADNRERLACYDNWAQLHGAAKPPQAAASAPAPNAANVSGTTNPESTATQPGFAAVSAERAAAQPSEITRFWDLENASARDTFEIRGYRPISLALATANTVNTAPSSPSPGHTAGFTPYTPTELKINLSVRTKVASGLLRRGDDLLRDSVWFGYTQQSYWQLFNGDISRPFRATDHEPEIIYVYPHSLGLPGDWVYRMSGVGVVHQSNGQSLPLSRSWNRVYLMGAADKITPDGDKLTLGARAWRRLPEGRVDDNPDISSLLGRAEFYGRWSFDSGLANDRVNHTLGLTLRHSLKREANGSVRVEYLRSIGRVESGLRFHTQLFSGYGDSLIDYNRRRTVLTLGLSLVDW